MQSKRVVPIIAGIVTILMIALAINSQKHNQNTPEPITLTISAAASMTEAFQELGPAFTEATGTEVIFNFASSGQLAEQIRQGALVDVYAAANVNFVDQLDKEGFLIPETKAIYAQGRITLWVPQDSPLQIETVDDLAQPEIERIAIADPANAPYGVASVEALESAGIWDELSPKILLGKNISQTLSYAQTGEVDVAIVALSLSLPNDGRWVLIPAEMHNPLNQAMAVLANTKHPDEAEAFVNFVIKNSDGRAIMQKYGFMLPGEILDND